MIEVYAALFALLYLVLIFGGTIICLRTQPVDVQTQIAIGNKLYCRVYVVDVDTGELVLKGYDYFEIRKDEHCDSVSIELKKTNIYRREEYVCGRACELYFYATGRAGKIKYKVTEAGRRAGITL